MTYVALLRGVNVGGARKVPMADLAGVFEKLGFSAVKTYINSGNVIFVSPETDRGKLTLNIETALEKKLEVTTQVLIKTIDELKAIVAALPDEWVNDVTMKCDVMFLFKDLDSPSVLTLLPKVDAQTEDLRYVPGAILWRVDRTQASKSAVLKIASSKLYKQMTIRNCNSTRNIFALMQAATKS